jgi:hypothetical protein
VNCRVLPDEKIDDVTKTLVRVLDDTKISVTPVGKAVLSPASPLDPVVMSAVEEISNAMWPGVPVIPTMSGGYTDSRWLRNAGIPAYGISGMFGEPGKCAVEPDEDGLRPGRAHVHTDRGARVVACHEAEPNGRGRPPAVRRPGTAPW